MLKIAITGSIATGKSLVQSILEEQGLIVLDADKVVHNLLANDETIISNIRAAFGEHVFEDGKISRRKLANIIFKNPEQKKLIEIILHPEVQKEILRFFEKNKREKMVFVSVPLLYEVGWQKLFDYVIVVYADEKTQIKRLTERNSITEEEAVNLISFQLPQQEKLRLADLVIDNSKTIEATKIQIEYIIKKLFMLS